jgi:hypothetical protein
MPGEDRWPGDRYVINTVLSGITSAFSKDFLFASFLPAILLMVAVGGAVTIAVGWDAVDVTAENLTATQMGAFSAGGMLIGVVIAYLLSAMRGTFIQFWSGEAPALRWLAGSFLRIGEWIQRRRFDRLRERADRASYWLDVLDAFEATARQNWNRGTSGASRFRSWLVKRQARALHYEMSKEAAKAHVVTSAGCFAKYNNVDFVFALVKRRLTDWDEIDKLSGQKYAARLDREFGTVATIRATRLGNIIESYNHYAHKRYRLEAEVFWPRLRSVIPETYYALVQESKILLDFATTMASISVAFGLGALAGGPWLWEKPAFWIGIAAVAAASAAFFYMLSVNSAVQYGDVIRSCFDLYRLDLLAALQFERPTSLDAERSRWEKVSRLVVYATPEDLAIAPKEPAAPEPG